MRDRQIKLLESLIKIPSLSGYEEKLALYIQKELSKYVPKSRIKVDHYNNVTVTIKGRSEKVVMIDAHLDQVGFVIQDIDILGYVSVQEVGGVDKDIVQGRPVIIQSYKGKNINGVIDKKPIHYLADDETTRPDKHTDLSVNLDIGIRKGKNVGSYIRVGDPVLFKPDFSHMLEDYYYGYGFDDKVGCFMLMEIIKEIVTKNIKPYPTLIFSFSAQEETGNTGAKMLLKRHNPCVFIELDVTTATDVDAEEVFEREVGRCDLGNGIVLYRGVGIDHQVLQALERTGKQCRAKFQYQATNGMIGYTSEYLMNDSSTMRIATVGVPLRNMHTPVEVLNMKDVKNGISLLKNFLIGTRLVSIIKK